MTTITISAGGKVGAYRGEEGAFAATLVTHEMRGPFKAKAPKPGEPLEYMLHEWGFAIEDEDPEGCMVWISSGESTGPTSKTFGILTALTGGRTIPVGTTLDIDTHLIGRMALVEVRTNERGYLDCVGVTTLPKAMQKAEASKAKAAPAAAAVADAESGDDSLPF